MPPGPPEKVSRVLWIVPVIALAAITGILEPRYVHGVSVLRHQKVTQYEDDMRPFPIGQNACDGEARAITGDNPQHSTPSPAGQGARKAKRIR